jgi:hypothetical protein
MMFDCTYNTQKLYMRPIFQIDQKRTQFFRVSGYCTIKKTSAQYFNEILIIYPFLICF